MKIYLVKSFAKLIKTTIEKAKQHLLSQAKIFMSSERLSTDHHKSHLRPLWGWTVIGQLDIRQLDIRQLDMRQLDIRQ